MLLPLQPEDREQFILDNQWAFKYGAQQEFGMRDERCEEGEEVISRKTIEDSIDGENAEAYYVEGHAYDSPCTHWKDGKTGYDEASNKWYGNYSSILKYNKGDGLTTLLPEDDAARTKMGGIWRMPRRDEWEVISTKDYPPVFNWSWDEDKQAYYVSGPGEYADRRIYFPAAGYRNNLDNINSGKAWFWTSTRAPEEEDMAIYFEVQPGVLGGISANVMDTDRYLGHCIRAVTE